MEAFNCEEEVENLYNMFNKYYSDEQLNNWQQVSFFGGGNSNKYKALIRELLRQNKKIKTGYRTSKMVRGGKDVLYIL